MIEGFADGAEPRRVLVTGATGTLGYNIVRDLAAKRPEVEIVVFARSLERRLFADLANVTARTVRVWDARSLHDGVAAVRPDAIVHCAASGVRPSATSWFDMIRLNVTATVDLFEASCVLPRCHFIHISTGLVYREQHRPLHEYDPVDTLHPYGASKATADALLRSGAERLGRRLTVIRPFAFTGRHDGGDRLFPSLVRSALDGRPFEMSAGTQIRDFCSVRDVASAVTLLLGRSACGVDVYNVGSGIGVSVRELVEDVIDRLNIDVEVRFGARDFGALEPVHLVADVARLRALGWRPRVALVDAVRELFVTLGARPAARLRTAVAV